MSSSSEDNLLKSSISQSYNDSSSGYTHLRPSRQDDSLKHVYLVINNRTGNISRSANSRAKEQPNYDDISFYDFPKSLNSDENLRDNHECTCQQKYINFSDLAKRNMYTNLKKNPDKKMYSLKPKIKSKHKRIKEPICIPLKNEIKLDFFKWLWNLIIGILEMSKCKLIGCTLLLALFIYYFKLLIFVFNCREVIVLTIF